MPKMRLKDKKVVNKIEIKLVTAAKTISRS